MAKHDGKKHVLIGDGGQFEKPDTISKITIIISIILIIVLSYLGVMAFIS